MPAATLKVPGWYWTVAYAMLAMELAGSIASLLRWKALNRLQRFLGFWFMANALFSILGFTTAVWFHNSRFTSNLSLPITLWFALAALGAIHGARGLTSATRVAAMAYIVVWLMLLITTENANQYSKFASPLQSIIIVVFSGAALVRRVGIAKASLVRDVGFLTAVGLMTYALPSAFLSTVAQLYARRDPMTLLIFYAVRQGIAILAMLVLVRALLERSDVRPA